jgi:hypothetical protein
MRCIVAIIVSLIHVNATAQITTTIPPSCEMEINPSYTIVVWKQSQQFSAALSGACNEPCYSWEVSTNIGSTIDNNGLYTAGMGNGVAEQITVLIIVMVVYQLQLLYKYYEPQTLLLPFQHPAVV